MKANSALFAVAVLAFSIPGPSAAQQAGTQAQRAENTRETNTVRARITATQDRVAKAAADRKITRAQATALKRQLAQTRQSMTRLGARQGFVSAAELASYNRTLSSIDTELDRRGVARSYGNDMLPAAHHGHH